MIRVIKTSLLVFFVALVSNVSIAAEPPLFALHAVVPKPTETSELHSLPEREGRSEAILVEPAILLGQSAIKSAAVESGDEGPRIRLTFTEAGAKKFAEITKEYLGKRLAIFVKGRAQSAPVIRDQILGGEVIISGNFSKDEAADLAAKLNASVVK